MIETHYLHCQVMKCPLFTNSDRSAVVFVPYKCTLTSHMHCSGAVAVESAPDSADLYAVVRHPRSRLESFIQDKLWRSYASPCSADSRATLRKFLSPEGVERLEAGKVLLEDVLGALESGMQEWHTLAQAEIIPEGVEAMKMEDPSTFETLSKLYGCPFPHLNVSKDKVEMPWSSESLERLNRLMKLDLERFEYSME